MNKIKIGLIALVVAGFGTGTALASKPVVGSAHTSNMLAHGRYLVTRAATCADCHSPRDMKGQYLVGHDLQGAPIGFNPIHPIPNWATIAPSIAGLPTGWTFNQTVHFLETGVTPSGGHARPPMPEFRFNAHDARAIATYLQSLSGPARH